jgi:hypothetical protein
MAAERAPVEIQKPLERSFPAIPRAGISEIDGPAIRATSGKPREHMFHKLSASVFRTLDGME